MWKSWNHQRNTTIHYLLEIQTGETQTNKKVDENLNEESDSDESVERFGDQYSDLIYNQDDFSDEDIDEDRKFWFWFLIF